MKYLVLLSLLAVAASAPVDSKDGDDDHKVSVNHHHFATFPGVVHHKLVGPSTHHVVGTTGVAGFVPGAVTYGAVDVDDDDNKVVVGHHGVVHHGVAHHGVAHHGVAHHAFKAHQAVPAVAVGAVHAVPSVTSYSTGHHVAAAVPAVTSHAVAVEASPAVATYNAGHVVASAPAVTSHVVASAPAVTSHAVAVEGEPAVATYNAGHVVASAPAAVSSHAVAVGATPAVATYATGAQAVAVAPAAVSVAAPVHYQAKVEVSEPVVTVHQQAVPSAVTYESQHVVDLGTKEVNVPVQTTHVHVPVEKRVHYGVEKYVAGSTTQIHKAKLSAPAIKAPAVFAPKIIDAAPEVTVQHSEVTVEKKSPNYVHQSYDAGVVVEKAAPLLKSTDVPTPVEVPHPVPVAKPYAVAVPTPVKVKSEVSPVYNVDVHTVETENVVTPVEYTAHHHVASAPVVHAAPAVHAVQAVAPVATGQQVVAAAVPATYEAHQVQGAVVHGAAVASEGQAVVGHSHLLSGGQVATHAHVLGGVPHVHGVGAGVSGVAVQGAAVPAVGVATYGAQGADVAVGGHAVGGHFVAGPTFAGHAATGAVGQVVTGHTFGQNVATGHAVTGTGHVGQVVTGHAFGGQLAGQVEGQNVIAYGAVPGAVQTGEVHGVQFSQGQPWKVENVESHKFVQGPHVTFSQGTFENHHNLAPAATVPESH